MQTVFQVRDLAAVVLDFWVGVGDEAESSYVTGLRRNHHITPTITDVHSNEFFFILSISVKKKILFLSMCWHLLFHTTATMLVWNRRVFIATI